MNTRVPFPYNLLVPLNTPTWIITDRDSAISKMITIAADKGVTLSSDEVQSFISEMNEDDEFDDIELTAAALSSIAGGKQGKGRGGC